ncbi:MAG TPA: glycoside hydrolase, partial [Phormidium sp.]
VGLAEIAELEAIAIEANSMHCQLKIREGKQVMERLILRLLWHLLHDANPTTMEVEINRLERMVDVSYRLNLGLSLDRAQEIFANALSKQILPDFVPVTAVLDGEKCDTPNGTLCDRTPRWELTQMRPLIRLAEKLKVDIDFWVSQLV